MDSNMCKILGNFKKIQVTTVSTYLTDISKKKAIQKRKSLSSTALLSVKLPAPYSSTFCASQGP